MNSPEFLLQPPLPAETVTIVPEARVAPRFRSPPFILSAAAAGALAMDCAWWTNDIGTYGVRGYGAACAILATVAAVFLMRKDIVWKTPAFAGVLATVAASAWTGYPLVMLVAPAMLLAWTRRTSEEARATPWPVAVLVDWTRVFLDALGRTCFGSFRGRVASAAAGVGALVFFLWILGSGNLALGHYLEKWERSLGDMLALDAGTLGRIALWCAGVASLAPLAVPRRKPAVWVPAESASAPVPATLAALVGANLAFLSSNLADTWCLGVRHAAPEGVSTTDYLHAGTYSLVFDAMLAALLLVVLFRNGAPARVSRPANRLGLALLAQCAWLGLGVAGRVALQVDHFGFTPNRLWIVVILIWGYCGLAAALRYFRARPDWRAFVRTGLAGALTILCFISFRPPEILATDLNLAFFRSHPAWKFDDGYFYATGKDGYRLWREIGKADRLLFDGDEHRVGIFDGVPRNWRVRSLHDDALDALYENDRNVRAKEKK